MALLCAPQQGATGSVLSAFLSSSYAEGAGPPAKPFDVTMKRKDNGECV